MDQSQKKDRNSTNYKRSFNTKNYERLYPWAKKGRKEFYIRAAKQTGMESLNEFIIASIEEKMQRETPEIYADMIERTEGQKTEK